MVKLLIISDFTLRKIVNKSQENPYNLWGVCCCLFACFSRTVWLMGSICTHSLCLLLCWAREDDSLLLVKLGDRTLRGREKTLISDYHQKKMSNEAVISQTQFELNTLNWYLRNQSPTNITGKKPGFTRFLVNITRHLPPGFFFMTSPLLDFNPLFQLLH